MEAARHDSQDELAALRAVVAEQAHKLGAQQAALNAEVEKRDAIIAILRAQLDLLRYRQHGASSEKIDRKIEQYELMLEEIEAARAESYALAERAPLPERDDEKGQAKRKPLPDTLAREDAVYEAPCSCPTR
jgi:transposase